MEDFDKCEKYWGLLNDLVDGRLDGRKRIIIEQHLASCSDCRTRLEQIKLLITRVSEERVPAASDAFWEGINQRLLESAGSMKRPGIMKRAWLPAFGLALGSSMAAVGLTIMLFLHFGNLPPAPTAEITHDDYVIEHAAFAVAQPLDLSSHNVLLSAQGMERREHPSDANEENGEF